MAEADGNFGAALAAGNMGRDTRDALAIGVPNHTVGGVIEAGAVSVLFGTSTGLAATNSVLVHLDVNSQTEARFGAAVAVAKLTVISPYASFADLVVVTIPISFGCTSATPQQPDRPAGRTTECRRPLSSSARRAWR